MFQFHFGTIRSCIYKVCDNRHFVSIPLWYDQKKRQIVDGKAYHCFNSTLVRLEESFFLNTQTCDYCFNSTLVRLEVVAITNQRTEFGSFNSTLVRLEDHAAPAPSFPRSSFNSTLVRLEARWLIFKTDRLLFQFHFGTIRSIIDKYIDKKEIRFNSTLVRLEVRS